MRTAELEVVSYKTDAIVDASKTLVDTCVEVFRDEMPSFSQDILHSIGQILGKNSNTQIVWNLSGLRIFFSGIPPTLPTIEGDQLVYKARSPHFILEEGAVVDLPFSTQLRVREANYAIVDVMNDRHGLEVVRDDPFTTLNFPKDLYAESVRRVTATILNL